MKTLRGGFNIGKPVSRKTCQRLLMLPAEKGIEKRMFFEKSVEKHSETQAATGVKPVAKTPSSLCSLQPSTHRSSSCLSYPFPLSTERFIEKELHERALSPLLYKIKSFPRNVNRASREYSPFFPHYPALHFLGHFFAVLQICCSRVFMTDDYTSWSQ